MGGEFRGVNGRTLGRLDGDGQIGFARRLGLRRKRAGDPFGRETVELRRIAEPSHQDAARADAARRDDR